MVRSYREGTSRPRARSRFRVEAAQNTLMVKIPCQAVDRAGAGSGSSSVPAANGRCLIGRIETYVINFGLGYINNHLVVTVGSLGSRVKSVSAEQISPGDLRESEALAQNGVHGGRSAIDLLSPCDERITRGALCSSLRSRSARST